ncbi:MAG: hypothetical protein HEQ29_12095 [Dolichospermum sp. LBC05a]|uniref:hypothetical protein n=1 Tax=Dolichospermum circinale TaxID=109265 RepID=UPI001AF74138|nr:hypothetical protein [Dolichospermum circinale]MBO1046956.1 hypothetical protein [Dolichospermum sp. DEX182a]MBS9393850.1 hypothetical protein [Dolichospermum sp. OL01]MCO5797482.1 hypothetical protein [Dolichospermum sp. OL03]MCS6282576.1 hypothetical protein [Dolichospermum sp.]QSV59003.1 MAG: hypothetical protein HEQ29_12095 [Dolichospermum sp. LBC05a]QSV61857.1 MAG: hypothetical protein HEQ26_02855 [Dolichospermum sp. DL01]
MLNHISKLMTSSQFKFPIVGLIVSAGVLGISYSSQQHYKLLSSTALTTNYVVPINQRQINFDPAVIKEEAMQKSPVNISNQISTDKLTENITALSTNTRELGRKGQIQFPEQDGTYLYGQSSTPNELGQGYILFQKQQSKIIGALYVPHSEFSCFQGTLAKSGELAMTVRSSPGEVGAMDVATSSTIPKVNENEFTTYPYSVTLQDYHQLSSVSSNDREILQICQQGSDGFK